jgi:hypothetical protein
MMKQTPDARTLCLLLVLIAGSAGPVHADERDDQIRALQKSVEAMQKQIDRQNEKIEQLLQDEARDPAAAAESAPATVTGNGSESPVAERRSFNDQQQAAPRPDDLTLDPKYRGFLAIPHTPVMIQFNAKPRVDMSWDPENTGNDNRFVTAEIPVHGDPDQGGDGVFNINAKGSQLRLDVRAPTVRGNPRFYYENDFYGSGGGEFPYRVRHLFGQIYNVILGQTFSVFEDPDIWPDTVDYEGPNSAIFARRPLVRYQYLIDPEWQMNFGIEQPESEVDLSYDPAADNRNKAPDGGVNVRWERDAVGHVQAASIFRSIGVDGPVAGNQSTLGWGLNLSGGFEVFDRDALQLQATYGHGLFRYSNDDFEPADAAFDADGDLVALPYLGLMVGYTHRWNESFRSTASYGFVDIDNEHSQPGSAYHQTHYASVNLMWQLRQRLSVGIEQLYGSKETRDGNDGDVFRTQLGVVYSIF